MTLDGRKLVDSAEIRIAMGRMFDKESFIKALERFKARDTHRTTPSDLRRIDEFFIERGYGSSEEIRIKTLNSDGTRGHGAKSSLSTEFLYVV